jgi:hypothetical protein
MTVVAHLVGGLGNQLFQLAAAHHVALGQSRSIVVDVTEARLVHDRQGLLPLYEGLSTIDFSYGWLPWQINSRQARIRQSRFIRQSSGVAILHTDELEQFVDDGTSLYVHLQGLLMSRDIVDRACGPHAQFRPRLAQPSPWFHHMRGRAAELDPVGMHVRRGDFLKDRARGILTGSYYRRALDVLARPDRPVWVFSDDPLEAAEFLGLAADEGFEFIQLPRGVPAAEALMLLSSLRTLITCNSTFSWWAAFLSDAVVTYPSPLMADTPSPSGHHRSPMNDPSWIQVPAEYL